ncbi:MAG: metal-dependent transcriptional regulator [Firmicutes bacterium]|jgi:DtxR family Mn-dependent transcriptional regulator|nr:metal-dependent transcriptional regulator [Bacillota bacterium]
MKKISPSLEDYLEAVLRLAGGDGGVRTTDIARELDVSKASVNQAVGLLSDRGLVNQERYGPIYLTDDGELRARAIYRRHQSIKAFLVSILGVDENTAEEDACNIEHVISKETMARLLEYMDKEMGT